MNHKGQILLEALLGIALLVLGVGLGVILIFANQRSAALRTQSTHARLLVKEGLLAAREAVLSSWTTVADGSHGVFRSGDLWQFTGTEDVSGMFTRKIVVTTIDVYTKDVKSNIMWSPSSGRTKTVSARTLVTHWLPVLEEGGGPGSGDVGLSGDWRNPVTIGSYDVQPSGRKGTAVAVRNGVAYLTTDFANQAAAELSVFDVSNASSPVSLADFDRAEFDKGLSNIFVSSTYAYVVSASNNHEFAVINISNPSSPSLAATLNLSGTADAVSVYGYKNHVYVGRNAAGGVNEFEVIDVSDPLSPLLVAGMDIGARVSDLYADDDRVYLATEKTGEELIVVSVVNPAVPVLLDSFSVPAGGGEGDGQSVFVQSDRRVYLGTGERFYVLNAASGTNILSYDSVPIDGGVNDMAVVGNYAFLATSGSTSELHIIDVSDPAAIFTISQFNYPQEARGIDYEGNYVYAAVRSNDALRIITSQ